MYVHKSLVTLAESVLCSDGPTQCGSLRSGRALGVLFEISNEGLVVELRVIWIKDRSSLEIHFD